jgi:thiamine kinase-like enzyme
MIQWLPLDIGMPALAHDPMQLRLRLQAVGVDIAADGDGPRLLAYEPRRRAVVRLDGHVIKIHGEDSSFAAAVAALERVSRLDAVTSPRSEGILQELKLTCEELLPGSEAHALQDAAAAGSALSALHRSQVEGLRAFSAPDQLKAVAMAADSATVVVPELEDRLQAFLRTLELIRPELESVVPAHGNFHVAQLLRVDGTHALTDFDHMRAAPAALDLASYAARLVNGEADDDLASAAAAIEGLVEGYGSRPRGLSWYLATSILLRSSTPFHLQKSHWPIRIEKMIGAAEEALHL